MKLFVPAWLLVFLCCISWAQQDRWIIRLDGVGPVKIGMTFAQLSTTMNERFSAPRNRDEQGCLYVKPKSHSGIRFMIEDSHLVRVDVDKPDIPTDKSVRVGDSEEQVKKAYGPEVKTEQSKYTGDEGRRYLTFRSRDGKFGVRFETEKGKVTTFYAGTYETIQYVEGCE